MNDVYDSYFEERHRRIKAEKKLKIARTVLTQISRSYTEGFVMFEQLTKLAKAD